MTFIKVQIEVWFPGTDQLEAGLEGQQGPAAVIVVNLEDQGRILVGTMWAVLGEMARVKSKAATFKG